MSGFCNIQEKPFEQIKTAADGTEVIITYPLRYQWTIYAGNMRQIAQGRATGYNTAQHARKAAERFIKIVGNVRMNSGIVRKYR